MALELNRYYKYLKRGLGRKNKLNFLILYTTANCNLSCRTCFFHANLNKGTGFSLAEYKKIAARAGKFSILLLSGGEPFLRNDLIEICSEFIKKCSVDSLIIPTNATLTDVIMKKTEKLLKRFPSVSISVNPSIDGPAAYHDKNRGVPGTFEKAIDTVKRLSILKKHYPNLKIVVNSVMEERNLDELKELMIFMRRLEIDFHDFEILRGDYKDNSLRPPALEEIKKMHRLILANRLWYLNRDKKIGRKRLVFWLERIAIIGALRYSQVFKELALRGKEWPSKCPAGKDIAVIYPDGGYSDCELRPVRANLKDYNFQLGRLGKKNKSRFGPGTNCACTHICFIHACMARDWKSIFKIPYYYFESVRLKS